MWNHEALVETTKEICFININDPEKVIDVALVSVNPLAWVKQWAHKRNNQMLIDFAYCYFLHRIVECTEKQCIIEAASLLYTIGSGRFTSKNARWHIENKAALFRHKFFHTPKHNWLRDGNLIYCLKKEGYNSGRPIMVNDITVRVEASGPDKSRAEEVAILIQNTLNKQ